MNVTTILAVSAVLAVAACTNSKTATEADFGNSKASLINAQTANPEVLSNPSTETVTGVDPDYASNVIKAMRENVSTPEEVQQPISIRVGGNQGGT
jgi:type IV pilus biogenesis protein CpaD/CtpE